MIKCNIEQLKEQFSRNKAACDKVINIFSLISNKCRFRILCLLTKGDFCVNEIVEIIQVGKVSNISQQLKLLTLSGILEKRRDNKHVIYHLKDEQVRQVILFFEKLFMT
jgi:DNA-binding transcriptional ArsR family regulator